MIKAEKLEYNTITDALLKGHFYASRGAEIDELYIEDNKLVIRCKEAVSITLNTGRRSAQVVYAPAGKTINEASFEFEKKDVYLRITVKNEKGQTADTNAYFIDEL